MSYNTFGRYRYTMKDSTRRALDARLQADRARCAKAGAPDILALAEYLDAVESAADEQIERLMENL